MKTVKAIMFWLLSLTWGALMTLCGGVVALALLVTGHKPKRFHYLIYFEVGSGWGGFELGAFFVVNKNPSLHILPTRKRTRFTKYYARRVYAFYRQYSLLYSLLVARVQNTKRTRQHFTALRSNMV